MSAYTGTIEEIRKAEDALKKKRETSRDSILKSVSEMLEDLKSLGFVYVLKSATNGKSCSVCGQDGHNARFHQAKEKKT